jgi:hypothetical protein
MPFPFNLPTTSSANLSDFLTSATHPSLPLLATTKRSVLKDALKKHKRTPARDQPSHLPAVQDAINAYLPYLLALNTTSGYRDVNNEQVDVEIVKPLSVEWRPTLSATPPRPRTTKIKSNRPTPTPCSNILWLLHCTIGAGWMQECSGIIDTGHSDGTDGSDGINGAIGIDVSYWHLRL